MTESTILFSEAKEVIPGAFLFPFIIIVSLAQGCSFSHSSESSSDSSGSSSKSSGSSSSSTSSESSKDTEEY
jgi:hypothetical protein